MLFHRIRLQPLALNDGWGLCHHCNSPVKSDNMDYHQVRNLSKKTHCLNFISFHRNIVRTTPNGTSIFKSIRPYICVCCDLFVILHNDIRIHGVTCGLIFSKEVFRDNLWIRLTCSSIDISSCFLDRLNLFSEDYTANISYGIERKRTSEIFFH